MAKSQSQRWYDEKGTPAGVDKFGERPWEPWEEEIVKTKTIDGCRVPDLKIAERIKRTVNAIHGRRSLLKQGYVKAQGCRVW